MLPVPAQSLPLGVTAGGTAVQPAVIAAGDFALGGRVHTIGATEDLSSPTALKRLMVLHDSHLGKEIECTPTVTAEILDYGDEGRTFYIMVRFQAMGLSGQRVFLQHEQVHTTLVKAYHNTHTAATGLNRIQTVIPLLQTVLDNCISAGEQKKLSRLVIYVFIATFFACLFPVLLFDPNSAARAIERTEHHGIACC